MQYGLTQNPRLVRGFCFGAILLYTAVHNMNKNSPDSPFSRPLLLRTAAAVLLLIPIVALLWVGSYAQVEPRFAGFPFFIWYQFLWVFLCPGFLWSAYELIRISRRDKDKDAP